MKSKSKAEIAMAAGISPRTFARWLKNHREKIKSMGVGCHKHLLPPRIVEYICGELGIHEEDFVW